MRFKDLERWDTTYNQSKAINLDSSNNAESTKIKYPLVALGQICTLEYGKALPEKKRVVGEFPVLGSNGIVGYHNEFIAQAPTIIIGRKGSAGKVTYIEKNCFPIDTTFYVRLNKDCDTKFLYFVLRELNLDNQQVGIGVPGINRSNVYKIKIPLPPLETQKEIVAFVEQKTAHISHLTQERTTLQNSIELNLQKMLVE